MPSIIHSGNNNSPNIINQLLSAIQAAITDIKMFYDNLSAGWSGTFTDGDGGTVTVVSGLVVSVEAPPLPPLRLTWDAIGNAMFTDIGDYNTYFGSDFTTLTVDGNDQLLTGNSTTFAMPASAFNGLGYIVAIDDTAESCTSVGDTSFNNCTSLTTVSLPVCTSVIDYGFNGCTALTSVSLPACTSLADSAFYGCTALTILSFPACTSIYGSTFGTCTALTTASLPICTSVASGAFISCTALTTVTLPLCADLGGTTGNDFVFANVSGQTITLTIAASRETCDGGNPDGDIVYLSANNTATIIYV